MVTSVHKEEFLDLKAETGNIVERMEEFNVFKSDTSQKVTDDHYKVIQL